MRLAPRRRHVGRLRRTETRVSKLHHGGQLLEGLHGIARSLGLEQLHLTVRGGTGVEGFYERFGYTVIGRHPGAIRVASGDDRDELILVKTF